VQTTPDVQAIVDSRERLDRLERLVAGIAQTDARLAQLGRWLDTGDNA
jgi:hypothetical protein